MTDDLAKIIKSNPDVVDETLDADTLAVAGAHYIINKRLVVKDNTFQKHLGNGESEVIEGQELKVVIVRMAHSTSRIYYPNSFTQGTYTKPTCWSSDSKVPDREVLKPLSNSCNQCPYSVRNSVVSNGSSCRLSWRIAVVTADNLDGDVLQLIIFSKVNANRVVTKLHLDPLAQYPRMLFSPRAAVDSQYFEGLQKLGESEEAVNAVQLNVVPKLPDPEAFGFSKEDSMQPDRRAEANEIVQKWSHISKEI